MIIIFCFVIRREFHNSCNHDDKIYKIIEIEQINQICQKEGIDGMCAKSAWFLLRGKTIKKDISILIFIMVYLKCLSPKGKASRTPQRYKVPRIC